MSESLKFFPLLFLAFILFRNSFSKAAIKEDSGFRKAMEGIHDFLENPEFDANLFDKILSSGEMNGFYSTYEIYDIAKSLSILYPNYVGSLKSYGQSFYKREIKAFRIGDLSKPKRK